MMTVSRHQLYLSARVLFAYIANNNNNATTTTGGYAPPSI